MPDGLASLLTRMNAMHGARVLRSSRYRTGAVRDADADLSSVVRGTVAFPEGKWSPSRHNDYDLQRGKNAPYSASIYIATIAWSYK